MAQLLKNQVSGYRELKDLIRPESEIQPNLEEENRDSAQIEEEPEIHQD